MTLANHSDYIIVGSGPGGASIANARVYKEILIAAGANLKTTLRGIYEAGHPCCTAPIGKIIEAN